jgi:hypothetical protein
MRRTGYGVIFAAILALSVPLAAQKPASAPANSTAQCTDGTFSTAKTEQGACSKHGGVKTWFGAPKDAKGDTKATATKETATAKGSVVAKDSGAVPAGSTGQCTDGSYTKAATKTGACSQHGGVKTWFADTAHTSGVPPVSATPTATPKNPPTPTPAPPASGQAAAPATSGKAQVTPAPAGTPANATAKCKDNTYSFAKTHSGACSHHGGVAEWYK